MHDGPTEPDERAARLYDVTAARAGRAVLAGCPTSFGLGSRLLGARARADSEGLGRSCFPGVAHGSLTRGARRDPR